MPNFTGLNRNGLFTSLYSMIIDQRVFSDLVKGTYSELVDMARVDGSQYGDQKLYYSPSTLHSYEFGANADPQNLLSTHMPEAPKVQSIVLNVFRQVVVTTEDIWTKQLFMNEGIFTSFNDIMIKQLAETKKIWESTTFNTFIGTNVAEKGRQNLTITPVENQNDALTVSVALANIAADLKDINDDLNDWELLRSYDPNEMVAVFNAEVLNQLRKADVPQVYHIDNILKGFTIVELPARYFGEKIGNLGESATIMDDGNTYRTLVEGEFEGKHLYPGQVLPVGANVDAGKAYKEDGTIAFKLYHKRGVPFMSSFTRGSAFFNAHTLKTNNYLTWGCNTLEHLKEYPFITAKFKEMEDIITYPEEV